MKIIDLLNKIANGEEIPNKIRVHYRVFEKYLNHNAYLNTEDEENYKYLTDLPRLFVDDRDWLNEEVEILEEEKKIPEKLEEFDIQGLEVSGYSMTQAEYLLEDGIKENREMLNWILDYLKSKGE